VNGAVVYAGRRQRVKVGDFAGGKAEKVEEVGGADVEILAAVDVIELLPENQGENHAVIGVGDYHLRISNERKEFQRAGRFAVDGFDRRTRRADRHKRKACALSEKRTQGTCESAVVETIKKNIAAGHTYRRREAFPSVGGEKENGVARKGGVIDPERGEDAETAALADRDGVEVAEAGGNNIRIRGIEPVCRETCGIGDFITGADEIEIERRIAPILKKSVPYLVASGDIEVGFGRIGLEPGSRIVSFGKRQASGGEMVEGSFAGTHAESRGEFRKEIEAPDERSVVDRIVYFDKGIMAGEIGRFIIDQRDVMP